MKRFLIVFIFGFTFSFNFAQTRIEIKGIIVDTLNQVPVSFANIYLKQSGEGTCTNYEGKFILKIEDSNLKDTIKISHIGYRVFEIPLQDFDKKDSVQLSLSPLSTDLGVVTVYPSEVARALVRKAYDHLAENYPNKRHYYSAFFRETVIQDRKSVRLTEAALHIEDPGFRKDVHNVRIQIDQLRRSNDYSEKSSWDKISRLLFGKSNSLYDTYESNNFRIYYSNRKSTDLIYGDKFFKLFDFYKTGETYIDTVKVVIIDYEAKGIRKKQMQDTSSRHYFTQGRLFITSEDNAIIRMEDWFGPILKPKFKTDHEFTIDNQYISKVICEFRKHSDNKYYLSWIEKTIIKSANSYNQYFLFINKNPVDNPKSLKVKGKFLFPKDIDLYNAEVPYNEDFWDSFNSVLINPVNEKTLREIQRVQVLKDQFRANKK